MQIFLSKIISIFPCHTVSVQYHLNILLPSGAWKKRLLLFLIMYHIQLKGRRETELYATRIRRLKWVWVHCHILCVASEGSVSSLVMLLLEFV